MSVDLSIKGTIADASSSRSHRPHGGQGLQHQSLCVGSTLPSSQPVFLMTKQPLPATLLRLFLLVTGIVANSGPPLYCSFCQVRLGRRDCSVRYSSCHGWCHLRCSNLANSDDWSPAFTCPVALSAPTPPAFPVFHTNA
ncbi:unnamed protein product [Dibothriocephalus latus]|uniref:Uncharacterized protein n=1 Tax=Dibothriocephalus latus TaxID=60516 RepID=A0A3P7M713_DIBLA|nr:unnamed protein product [Dibothriocephalus latus]